MSQPFYDSDLTDEEWQHIEPLLPAAKPVGKHRDGYFRLWVNLEVWEQINTTVIRQVRKGEGRKPEPSLAIIDSQSVKLGQKGAKNTGLMATKR